MTYFALKKRTVPLLLMTALTAALLFFAGRDARLPPPQALSSAGQEAIDAALLGRPRHEILAAWGKPDGMLSGFFGDIYQLSGSAQMIVYYDTTPMNQGETDSLAVPVQSVRVHNPEKEVFS